MKIFDTQPTFDIILFPSDQTIHIKFNSMQTLQYLHLFDYTS